jgi:hypothetical protein
LPPQDSDALGVDRELVLDFDAPIRASDAEATIDMP